MEADNAPNGRTIAEVKDHFAGRVNISVKDHTDIHGEGVLVRFSNGAMGAEWDAIKNDPSLRVRHAQSGFHVTEREFESAVN